MYVCIHDISGPFCSSPPGDQRAEEPSEGSFEVQQHTDLAAKPWPRWRRGDHPVDPLDPSEKMERAIWIIYGLYMDYIWIIYGLYMDYIWIIYNIWNLVL